MTRRGAALGLLGAGIGLLLVLAALVIVPSQQTMHAQERLRDEVPAGPAEASTVETKTKTESQPAVATSVDVGHALVHLRVPALGRDWDWVVLEGTTSDVLADGPGHYVDTPLPGDVGNVAIAGHRAGHGDPFLDFDRLKPGDHLLLSQGRTTWDYVVDTKPKIISATASWVLDPLPGRRLTMTTCWPKYGSSKRMYIRAHLAQVTGPGSAG